MSLNTKIVAALVAACCLIVPATVVAQPMPEPEVDPGTDDPDDVAEDELDDDDRDWSVSGSLRMRVGQGTFASIANDSEHADNVHDGSGAFNRVSMGVGINPTYQWGDYEFSGEIGYSQYLSAGGGSVRPYEGRFQDIELSASREGYTVDAIGVTISPSARVTLPASKSSRAATMIAGTGLSLGFSKTFFDQLTLSYGLGGSRNFHQYTAPVGNIDEIGEENALYRVDGTEAIEAGRFIMPGRLNTQWGMSHSLSAMVMFGGKVMAMANYSLSSSWTYAAAYDDEFSSQYQCETRCSGQMAMGMINVSYILNETMSLSFGMANAQSPKTADQRSYNFPFWNFSGAASNSSSISMGVMGRY